MFDYIHTMDYRGMRGRRGILAAPGRIPVTEGGAVQLINEVSALVLVGILAWIPFVRMTPEYDNVVEVLGGRPAETSTTDPAELEALLADRTVLLIPEQYEAEEATLEDLGLAAARVLADFLARGGRIVGMTYSKGADDILRGAGLWDVVDGYDVTGAALAVAVSGHPLVEGVDARFDGADGSTDFSGLPDSAVVLVWDTFDKAPVVFTWETGGGAIIMLGFDLYAYEDATARIVRNAVGIAAQPVVSPLPRPDPDDILRDLGAADIEEILVDLGLTFDRRTDSRGDPYWVLYLDDLTVVLSVDDEVEGSPGRHQYLQLYAGWITEGGASCEVVNEWNYRTRGGRAYLDADGDVVLESDLYVRGGLTQEAIVQFFKRFERLAKAFEAHLAGE